MRGNHLLGEIHFRKKSALSRLALPLHGDLLDEIVKGPVVKPAAKPDLFINKLPKPFAPAEAGTA
jgi:hypothetical protein